MGGDVGKDFKWDTVDGNERVPPFTDSCQRGRGIEIKSRNLIKGEPTEEVGELFSRTSMIFHIRRRIRSTLQLLAESEDELRNGQALPRMSL